MRVAFGVAAADGDPRVHQLQEVFIRADRVRENDQLLDALEDIVVQQKFTEFLVSRHQVAAAAEKQRAAVYVAAARSASSWERRRGESLINSNMNDAIAGIARS